MEKPKVLKCTLKVLENRSTFEMYLKEYSSLQENPYNVRYIHTVLIIHIEFAPQVVDNV